MPEAAILDVYDIRSQEQAVALLHPLRAEILAHLREPASAAEAARRLGEPQPKVNYHVKELERVGLVRRAGSRRKRNLVEVLYRGIARTYVIADDLGFNPAQAERLRKQGSLARLVEVAGRVRRDALVLLDRLADAGGAAAGAAEVPSASALAEVRLTSQEDRKAFLTEYLRLVRDLAARYAAQRGVEGQGARGDVFQVVMAVYPRVDADEGGGKRG